MAPNPNRAARLQWAVLLLLLGASVVCAAIWGATALSAGALAVLAWIAVVGIEYQRRTSKTLDDLQRRTLDMKRDRDHTLREIGALMYMYDRLHPAQPLPSAEEWTVRPDLAARVVSEMLAREAPTVLELGSGVSTVIAATCAKQHGGRVISYDAEEQYADVTRAMLAERGLQDCAIVHTTPLRETAIGDRRQPWYGIDTATLPPRIDILFVDGPPRATAPLARFPALPVLYDRLPVGAVVILDDGGRKDEQEIARLWLELYPDLQPVHINSRSGAIMLRKTARPA